MLGAYSMFPNRGIRTEPIFISKIEDKHGNIIYNAEIKQNEIINEHTAHKMVLMLEGVTNGGTATRLRTRYGLSGEMAGKTGTTNNQADAWFIGFTPQLLAGAWVGCDDRYLTFSSTAQGQGAAAALPIWALFFKKLYNDPSVGYTSNERFIAPMNFTNCGGGFYNSGSGVSEDSTDNAEQFINGELSSENTPEPTPKPANTGSNNNIEVPLDDW
jgi:penicillin-binding protein 1A